MRYRHVIWDWNGTVVDDVTIAIEIANRVLAARDLPLLTLERHRENFQIPIEHYYRGLGLQFTPEGLIELDETFHREYDAGRDRIQVFPDIPETLRCIQDSGARNSVLSALPEPLLSRDISHLGLDAHFERVIGRNGKLAGSKAAQGVALMNELSLEPREILVIGDTIYDAEVAKALGADCALIARGHQDTARLEASSPTILAHSLAELLHELEAG